jgi:AcrR family transcriptional regulator
MAMVKQLKTKTNKSQPGETQSGGPAARRDELREALLAALERTVVMQGWQALRARDLAREVGCAVGAIYNVFPDLDALVFAAKGRTLDLLDHELADAVRAVAATGSASPGVATRQLLALADAYLRFAVDQSPFWRMLYEHRAAPGTEVPEWYRARLAALFGHLNAPLRAIVPDLAEEKRALLGRALFSAVHGIVALGLEERIDTLSHAAIAGQVATIVRACVAGLMARGERGEVVQL